MIDKNKLEFIRDRYGIDFFEDMMFSDPSRVSFFVDLQQRPLMFHVVIGDITLIGLNKQDSYNEQEVLNQIEPDNLLAEVEGKNNFIEMIKFKFNTFIDELFLYIPIKSKDGQIWLNTTLKKYHLDDKAYVIANVIRVYRETPPEIVYYQKTYQDPMTKLFTRETLKMHMDNLTNIGNSYIMYLDIDGFKQINDQLGHQVGDQFLIDIANHFISKWEHNVLYYRLGGDEFFLYCYDHSEDEILSRAKQLIHDIENLNDIAKTLTISVSIGIVKITQNTHGYHRLLNIGDQTMYLSKNRGKGQITLHKE
ncbi:diguanylate cyclase (GGDEF)-like protein [Acholeplasma morum]|uniref:GGDEF domain-containing protein n=1 Tax=Paracholeplasma morum TaxID=264637 RepID=UPI001958817C|nr:GGDEF domain-containing protein [Paracholeplasma morum]MBM7453595.1 diguanylate cyclase (GGDEF)-like protein [Paracholeplasma morum]